MDEIHDTTATNTVTAAPPRTTPMHLWVVGILSLFWNCFGALDYTMTNIHNAAYLAKVPAEMIAYVGSVPAWFTVFWALGVWGALAGSVLLLMRNRLAVPVFAASLLGLAVTTLYQHVINPAPAEMRDGMMFGITVLIWAIAIALLLYARTMARQGVLR